MNEDIRIEPLRGPERVRRRAAVIFGDDGLEGVCEQVNLLLDIFLPQVKSGFCKHLIVKRDATEVLTLEGDDMGLYLCDPLAPSDEIWQTLFCQMQVLPRGEDYAYGLTKRQDLFQPPQGSLEDYIWYQLNLYSAQCASEFFSVRVRRDGYEYKLHFEKGEPESSLEVTPCDAPSGTCFTFRPDNTVFRDICLSAEQLAAFGRLLSLDNPGLAVTVVDEKLGLAQDFCCPNGILDALDVDTPVYTAAGYAKGRERYDREEYEANVHLALTFCTEGGAECIHNGRWLPDGGIHLDALYKKLQVYLEARLGRKYSLKRIRERTRLVLVTEAGETCWVNGSRKAIGNTLLRDMTEDTMEENFLGYLDYYAEDFRKLLA